MVAESIRDINCSLSADYFTGQLTTVTESVEARASNEGSQYFTITITHVTFETLCQMGADAKIIIDQRGPIRGPLFDLKSSRI